MPEIKVTVDQLGGTVVETEGFQGKECMEATKQLKRALGKVTGEKKTKEFHQTAKRQLKGRA